MIVTIKQRAGILTAGFWAVLLAAMLDFFGAIPAQVTAITVSILGALMVTYVFVTTIKGPLPLSGGDTIGDEPTYPPSLPDSPDVGDGGQHPGNGGEDEVEEPNSEAESVTNSDDFISYLPDDIPHRSVLTDEENRIGSMEVLLLIDDSHERSGMEDNLEDLHMIGPKRAEAIRGYLEQEL